ncbi:SDR family NAD(P)-dependent oxidoreductase [Salinibacterium sp. NG253]|uniref:SDR family NAD(P)-dependent oxidoreductase n=1 Tax=Salinibacterium sp. NG253 TaxID=2792039 RepID=UPI0018CDFC90|nr:SDR family NAD(P)-dependent oxidoreductase [Salinibacterium sp. NG253]MBH0115261.1 SDR family NAD(P)-dependent oxidoreductase [Salinibacterium sp. NG253]
MDLNNRRGIITGAGQGIGQAIALEFAAKGAHLLLVGRKEATLQETADLVKNAGGTSEILVQDLGQADGARNVADAVKSWDTIDLLVNNAGNVRAGRLEESTAAEATAMIDLNLTAPVLLTQALLPQLRASGAVSGSLILNISSEIALVAMPFYAVYAATKSGLAAFGEAMRRELHGTGVHVATVYPGATDTDMMSSQNADWERRPVSDVVAQVMTGLASDEHEINASAPDGRGMQELNASNPLAVDAAMAPGLADMEAAVKDHNSI